jgi:hypothetical protein
MTARHSLVSSPGVVAPQVIIASWRPPVFLLAVFDGSISRPESPNCLHGVNQYFHVGSIQAVWPKEKRHIGKPVLVWT